MLDLKFIRNNPEEIKINTKNRGLDIDIDKLLQLDEEKRRALGEIEGLRAIRNSKSKNKPADEEIIKMREVGDTINSLEQKLNHIEQESYALLKQIPNLTHPDVPLGGEDDFKVISTCGEIPRFDFLPRNHEELLLELDCIDFERGAKVAGNKFYFAKNDLVRLNQALIAYGIDIVTKHGYTLMETPDVARDEIIEGIGFNPRGLESQIYAIENQDISLVGTAEITVGGYHSNEILDLSDGPKRYLALSHCFRTEAGAYGRTSKGLYRVHQFTKLEMFIFCKPDQSESMHQELLDIEKEIVNGLELPYRVIDIAAGDLGGPAYRKYDIEAWMTMKDDHLSPAGGYGEITSTSNCTDYQARRLNIRYRNEEGNLVFVHTLNGTALNTSRFPIAIIENHQTVDGSVKIPNALKKYALGFEKMAK